MHKALNLWLIIFVLFALSCKTDKTETKTDSVPVKEASIRPPDSDTLNYIMGHFDPANDDRFVLIEKKYADREGMYMRKEAYLAFVDMHNAATNDGVNLIIRSAARNFDYQKGIWERKWTGATILSNGINAATQIDDAGQRAIEILKYSSMPGTSRHHWGTDVDFNSFDNEWFESGQGLVLFNWLEENASNFGFCRPYTKKDGSRPNGYNEEKWHWSFTPVADAYTSYAGEYLKNNMIKGFKGSETATAISVVDNYVLGIHHLCKENR